MNVDMQTTCRAIVWIMAACTTMTVAAPTEFDFKDPKGVNAMSIVLDSLLEPFTGYANGVSGTIAFDPENVKATKGSIIVDAATITMSHAMMTKVLHSEDWIDVAKYPTVEFAIGEVRSVEALGKGKWKVAVDGAFTVGWLVRAIPEQTAGSSARGNRSRLSRRYWPRRAYARSCYCDRRDEGRTISCRRPSSRPCPPGS